MNEQAVLGPLTEWMKKCTRKGKLSRNTVAMGIVVLDHLRRKCPLEPDEVTSPGGEIKGARSTLSSILEKYGIPKKYLKEVTTRAGHQEGQRLFDAFQYGKKLVAIPENQRDALLKAGIELLVTSAKAWLHRQHLRVSCDRQLSPAAWVDNILGEAKERSGGTVEQHLVGAKIACRHPELDIPNNPAHAGDVQTGRPGDFVVGTTVYHVTAAPGSAVVEKCDANLAAGLHPVVVVPNDQAERLRHIADDHGIARRITVIAIQDFIALNIIEMTKGQQQAFVGELKRIIETYNSRLESAETDLSLKIEVD